MIDIKLLEKASAAYYSGEPILSDSEFDKMCAELRQVDPENPFLKRIGAPPPGTVKAKHKIAMGSLSNANNEEEFKHWLQTLPSNQVHLSHKMDGLSVELIYQNGSFIRAITRGDGEIGEDVTKNVIKSGNIPLLIDRNITSIRCECIILKSDWAEYFQGDANPRNSAAGTLRRKDGHNAEYLRFYAFDAIGINWDTEFTALLTLQGWFFIPEWEIEIDTDVKFIIRWCKNQENNRDNLKYEIDGIVAKLDDRVQSQKMGSQNDRPKSQIAFKFTPRAAETILQEVVWQIGATGAIVPVAVVSPVGVGGTIIKRASLCNMDEIDRLQIAIGDTIEVIRAGDVIPKIIRRISKSTSRQKIQAPTTCPICNSPLQKNGAHLFCYNSMCEGRSFCRVMTWIKKRNILNLGPEIVKAIGVDSIHHLYVLNKDKLANTQIGNGRLGESRANKIIAELEKSRTVTLWEFLGCLGIKGIGRTLAKQIVVNLKMKTLEDIFALTPNDIQGLEGFAEQRAEDFCNWLKEHELEIAKLEMQMDFEEEKETTSTDNSLNGEVICFTGKSPKPRSEMAEMAAKAGATVGSSVTGKTTILVIADPNSVSSKAVKARKAGVKLISPENFLEVVSQ